jgi:hypothetical protein
VLCCKPRKQAAISAARDCNEIASAGAWFWRSDVHVVLICDRNGGDVVFERVSDRWQSVEADARVPSPRYAQDHGLLLDVDSTYDMT